MIRKIKRTLNIIRLTRAGVKAQNFEKISLGSTLNQCALEQGVVVADRASVTTSTIGKYSSIGRNTKVSHSEIGRFCAISWDCTINAIFHPLDRLSVHAFPYVPSAGGFVSERNQSYQIVAIGHDVWIGAQVIIMPGVKIGHGAVIGAGSVVTRDVEPYEVVCGNPARHLKWRFEEEIRNALLHLEWWEWSDEKIKVLIEYFKVPITKDVISDLRDGS